MKYVKVDIGNRIILKIVFESKEEELKFYNANLEDVLFRTTYYLENLDTIPEYEVSWIDYSYKKKKVFK